MLDRSRKVCIADLILREKAIIKAGVLCEYLAEFLKREGRRRRRRGREERRRERREGGREEEKREDSIITSKHKTSMDIDTM